MNVFDKIYKFIGENNIGVYHHLFEWNFVIDNVRYEISKEDSKNVKYLTHITWNTKRIIMFDDKISSYNCEEEVVREYSKIVINFLKDIENKFPDVIILKTKFGDVQLKDGEVKGTDCLKLYKLCKKLNKTLNKGYTLC